MAPSPTDDTRGIENRDFLVPDMIPVVTSDSIIEYTSASAYITGLGIVSSLGYSELVGDGVETDITVTHNLDTLAVITSVRDAVTGEEIIVDNDADTADTVIFHFTIAPSTEQYRVTILGV